MNALWLSRWVYGQDQESYISMEPAKGRYQIARQMELCAELGIDLVFPAIRCADALVSSRSSLEESFYPWDVLQSYCEEAHARRIKVHPWIVMWGDSRGIYPQWQARGYRGPHRSTRNWVCPARPEVQAHNLGLIREWLEGYPIDGVHLDYIRYIDQPCYCDYHRETFRKEFGLDPLEIGHHREHPYYRAWCDFNRAGLTDFIRRLSGLIHGHGRLLSAAVFPNRANPSFVSEIAISETWCNVCALKPDHAYCGTCPKDFALFQDWGDWCRQGYLDLAVPMNYTDQLTAFTEAMARHLAQRGPAKLLEGLGLWKTLDDLQSVEAFLAQIEAARRAGADGVCHFEWRRLSRLLAEHPEVKEVLRQAMRF